MFILLALSLRAWTSRRRSIRVLPSPAVAGVARPLPLEGSRRSYLIATTLVGTASAVLLMVGLSAIPSAEARTPELAVEGSAPPFDGAAPWFNSPPLGRTAVDGKVRVVSFWTYSCINCLRTLPALRAWSERYADRGLVVVGVHTPEFAFERDARNVARAVRDLKISYPVVQDNDYRLWRAFGNQFWPAIFVIDAQGRIRHHQFGEDGLAETQAAIETLLTEAGAHGPARAEPLSADTSGVGLPADGPHLRSPETYLGFAQARGFVSPGGLLHGRTKQYRLGTPHLNEWAMSGEWQVQPDFVELQAPSGALVIRFHARDAHLVMGPAMTEGTARFVVTIDGKPPGDDHGVDVDADGRGRVGATRLYQLVRQRGMIDDRVVEVRFVDPGVRAYAFTFG